MMNEEQISDLANYIWEGGLHLADIKGSVEQWFEENQQPAMLSSKDLYNLADFIRCRYELDYSNQYIQDDLETWFGEGMKQEPTVVGLSDEQAKSFIKYWMNDNRDETTCYKEWVKTQTFTQSQQFTPDWSKIPDDSAIDGCKIDLVWTCCGGLIERETLAKFERPKPPAPKVGQVWMHKRKGTEYEVLGFTRTDVNGQWSDYVRYEEVNGNAEYSRLVDVFLTKFEQVQA
jgi:hypothetical protein